MPGNCHIFDKVMTNFFLSILVLLISSFGFNQINDKLISALQLQVQDLSSEKFEGRRAGSIGASRSADYIIEVLKTYQINPLGDDYREAFQFNDVSRTKQVDKTSNIADTAYNVIGFINNNRDRTIIIGAHYDHLGKGFHVNSLSTSEDPIHYGADDNASGVAGALQLGNLFMNNGVREEYNFLVILFSAEEIGLIGSKAWLNQYKDSLNIASMINLDMIGRMNDKKVQLYGIGTSPSWSTFLSHLDDSITWEIDSSGLGPSDHASFYLESIPAIHFFTGQHEDYHKETDTHDKLNYEGLAQLTETIYSSLMNIGESEQFNFTETKNKTAKKRPSLKVTMGIMPSYLSHEKGMKIDGVIENKPAFKAKMRKGDVIVSIDDFPIKDIYDYMEALSKYNVEDKAEIKIIRNNKTKTLTVTF